MEKKTEGFDDFSLRRAAQFAMSKEGQQLYALLQSTNSQQLQSAMDQAAAGNYEEVKKTLQSLMQSDEARRLLGKYRE